MTLKFVVNTKTQRAAEELAEIGKQFNAALLKWQKEGICIVPTLERENDTPQLCLYVTAQAKVEDNTLN